MRDGQPQARATVPMHGGRLGLHERLKQAVQGGRIHADAVVGDAQFQLRALPLQLHVDLAQRQVGLGAAAATELDGVAQQVGQHLAQACAVAPHLRRCAGGHIHLHPHAALLGGGGQCLCHRPHQGTGVQRGLLQRQPAGFDFREVQDVVDDAQQGAGRIDDGVHRLGLLRLKARMRQQLAHAQHAVHRRANLVTHGGQESTLGAVGGLGRVLGQLQRPRGVFLRRDVKHRGHHADHALLIVEERRLADDGVAQIAVVQPGARIDAQRLAGPRHVQPVGIGQGGRLRVQQVGRSQAQQLLGRQAVVFGVGAVQAQVAALHVLHHHRHGDGLEQGVHQRQAGPQFVGDTAALGHVAPHALVAQETALGIKTWPAVELYPAPRVTPGA